MTEFVKEPRELASWGTEYNPPGPYWTISLWLDWSAWSFGFGWDSERGSVCWPDRWWGDVSFGPLTLTATRTWNEVPQ